MPRYAGLNFTQGGFMKLTELYTVDDIAACANEDELKAAYFEAAQKNKDVDTDKFVTDALVACTIGWRGTDEKFTKKLCRELYEKAPFVKEQIDSFMVDRSNFTKAKPIK